MLSMEIDTAGRGHSYFRILAGTLVKYIVIAPNALDADSLDDMPLNFSNILPPLPYNDPSWSFVQISRDHETGELRSSISQLQLKGVAHTWHPKLIDFMQLERVESLSPLTQRCTWHPDSKNSHDSSVTTIAKMARFEWEIAYVERETRIYALLEGTGIAPRFLGHVHEQNRVIGFLLERIDGRPAGIDDLEICKAALKRLHRLGIIHGDCNRYNFVVGNDGKTTLVDFEKSTHGASREAMEAEMASLENHLREETGRGGGFLLEGNDED